MPEISERELRALVRDSIARHAAELGAHAVERAQLQADDTVLEVLLLLMEVITVSPITMFPT